MHIHTSSYHSAKNEGEEGQLVPFLKEGFEKMAMDLHRICFILCSRPQHHDLLIRLFGIMRGSEQLGRTKSCRPRLPASVATGTWRDLFVVTA
ncbi:uncharacterized protein VTP21DRAFT_290 [Calcarisporiella thermophila]|uniref:uncharacterized protein n=1 Tax=Calcarisporiella thermophila TaxID=911321 RepID=UPI0037443F82